MNHEDIILIKPGVRLQGDGGASTGAVILANKQADTFTDVILCYSETSPHDPFVVWTYHHERGICARGDYYNNIKEAMNRYEEREW